MKNNKIAEIERLIEKYKERLRVIDERPYMTDKADEMEIETLQAVIEDLESILA